MENRLRIGSSRNREVHENGRCALSRPLHVEDYLGLIEVGTGKGLVLGGDPEMMTAWLPAGPPGDEDSLAPGGMLVRWSYAESEEEVLRLLDEVPDSVWKAEDFVFEVGPAPLYLFGSAVPGNDLRLAEYLVDEYLMIHLPPGRYSVATALYEPNESTALVLHKLDRLTPDPGDAPNQVLQ